jgi:hypothetical protein
VCFGSSCNINSSRGIIEEKKLTGLSPEDKAFLRIIGVEKFLQVKYGK